MERERMNIVVTGHVDHGKSTVVGRMLADTGSLPDGKLEQVRRMCERNARPFEYAFLLDALKDEQSQGITIDSARCFFRTQKREYVIIDAPGHIEFLKNMVSGAARAEAALLVIDAKEGVRENSRRHGYLLSMLGIRQVAILVNKMDLMNFSESHFRSIVREYTEFLEKIQVTPRAFIPVSALGGDNIAAHSAAMPWYTGLTVLGQLDAFEKSRPPLEAPFRMPVQDVYKFTAQGDDRRIVAGTIESGTLSAGEEVAFAPSGKRGRIRTVESFPKAKKSSAGVGEAAGFTLTEELYIKPGELLYKPVEGEPWVRRSLSANIFWMGRQPMVMNRNYLLKLGSARVEARLTAIESVLDASALSTEQKERIERHEAARITLQFRQPLAFDRASDFAASGRFVIVDNYEIAGGGIVLEPGPEEKSGTCSDPFTAALATRVVVISESGGSINVRFAQAVEKQLKKAGYNTVSIDMVSFPDIHETERAAEALVERLKKADELADFQI